MEERKRREGWYEAVEEVMILPRTCSQITMHSLSSTDWPIGCWLCIGRSAHSAAHYPEWRTTSRGCGGMLEGAQGPRPHLQSIAEVVIQ